MHGSDISPPLTVAWRSVDACRVCVCVCVCELLLNSPGGTAAIFVPGVFGGLLIMLLKSMMELCTAAARSVPQNTKKF